MIQIPSLEPPKETSKFQINFRSIIQLEEPNNSKLRHQSMRFNNKPKDKQLLTHLSCQKHLFVEIQSQVEHPLSVDQLEGQCLPNQF
jgi:hypothetical protein